MTKSPQGTRALPLLLAGTVVFEGLRAGAGTFRLLLDLPARFTVGPVAFADFSRATDLSMRGIVFYAVYGIGGLLLTATTWLIASRAGASRSVNALAGAACLCSVAVLALTTRAAPLMWRLGSSPNDSAELVHLLDRFTFWTTLRIVCVDLSFLAVVAAMTVLTVEPREPLPPKE